MVAPSLRRLLERRAGARSTATRAPRRPAPATQRVAAAAGRIAQARKYLQLEPTAQGPSRGQPCVTPNYDRGEREAAVDSLRRHVGRWARALPSLRNELDAARRAFVENPDLARALQLEERWRDVGAVLTALQEAPAYAKELRRVLVTWE